MQPWLLLGSWITTLFVPAPMLPVCSRWNTTFSLPHFGHVISLILLKIKFGTAKKYGATKYAYATIENGNLKIEGIFDSLDEAVGLHCDNEGVPMPYMAWMDK